MESFITGSIQFNPQPKVKIEAIKSKEYFYFCEYCRKEFALYRKVNKDRVYCSSTCMIADDAVKNNKSKRSL